MKTFKKALFCVLLALSSVVMWTGCKTAEGFGEDMEDAGESIQREAD